MLPSFIEVSGAPYLVLPPGIHWATLDVVKTRFAATPRRGWLFEGLMQAVDVLRNAGCRRIFLDGSFVTSKASPSDYDGCWDPLGVVATKLDPVLLDFSDGRRMQKAKYRGELFIAGMANGSSGTFLEFFQTEKYSGSSKGIVGVALDGAFVSGLQS